MLADRRTSSRTRFLDIRTRILRRFRNPLASALSVAIAALAVIGGSGALEPTSQSTVPDARRPRPESFSKPAVIKFNGLIDYYRTQYFKSRFARAREDKIDLLILDINSPGGLLTESLQMARMIRDCDWAYVVCFVNNEAISGGALLTLGSDELYINPNAKFGDIGAIELDTELMAFRFVEPKIESYLVRDARDLAQSKGRPPELAEAMVDKEVIVYFKHKGNVPTAPLEFRTVRAGDGNAPDPPWVMIPESGPERFLTLNGSGARELGLAQHFATSLEEVGANLGIDIKRVRTYRETTTDRVVYYLNNPFVSGLLVVIGLIALYVELSAPGIGAGGLISGLCAVLFFWSRFLSGTSGWLEVILFAAGLVFLVMEIFVIPGFGVAGVSGLALIFSSVILAGQDFTMPATAEQWNQTITNVLTVLCSGFVFLFVAAFISKRLGSIPVLNRMVLAAQPDEELETKQESDKPTPTSHPAISVGDWGVAESLLRPAGRAKFAGRSFDVISDGSFVDPGSQVKVIRINGNVITVATIEEEPHSDNLNQRGQGPT